MLGIVNTELEASNVKVVNINSDIEVKVALMEHYTQVSKVTADL